MFLKPFTFSFYMTMSMIVSFLPLYYSSLGYSSLEVGILYALGPMIGIVSTFFKARPSP
jgi:MFS transporter, PPP family, 3-phenylpropionic acid transporter